VHADGLHAEAHHDTQQLLRHLRQAARVHVRQHAEAGRLLEGDLLLVLPAAGCRYVCLTVFFLLSLFSFAGSGAAEEIATEAEVVDLLVSMAKVGVKAAHRRELIFEPFPQICDPDNKEVVVLSPQQKDWALLEKLIMSIPSVQQMTQAEDFVSMKVPHFAHEAFFVFLYILFLSICI
jgi:hypothetical protein